MIMNKIFFSLLVLSIALSSAHGEEFEHIKKFHRYHKCDVSACVYDKFWTCAKEQLLKEIDDAMLWFDLTYLLNEPQEREAPEIHITIDYTVRAFEETEKEYLKLYSFFTH